MLNKSKKLNAFLALLSILYISCSKETMRQGHTEATLGVSKGGSQVTQVGSYTSVEGADSVIFVQYVHDTLRTVQKVYKPSKTQTIRDSIHLRDTLFQAVEKLVHDTIYRHIEPETPFPTHKLIGVLAIIAFAGWGGWRLRVWLGSGHY